MSQAAALQALQQYTKVSVHSEVEAATPHRLIQMLMEGALARISKARAAIKNSNIAEKGELIGSAISIIGGLRDSLDHEAGGQIAGNLEALYEYMTTRLLEANIHNDDAALTEVGSLLLEIKQGWDQIERFGSEQVSTTASTP